jgi:hypothetical protein
MAELACWTPLFEDPPEETLGAKGLMPRSVAATSLSGDSGLIPRFVELTEPVGVSELMIWPEAGAELSASGLIPRVVSLTEPVG